MALLAAELAAIRPPVGDGPPRSSPGEAPAAPSFGRADRFDEDPFEAVSFGDSGERGPDDGGLGADPMWLAAAEPLLSRPEPLVNLPEPLLAPPRLPGRHADRFSDRGQRSLSRRLPGRGRAASFAARADDPEADDPEADDPGIDDTERFGRPSAWPRGLRLRITATQVAVIALTVAMSLVGAAWWVFRSAPAEVALVGEVHSSQAASASADPGTAPEISGEQGASEGLGSTQSPTQAPMTQTPMTQTPADWSGANWSGASDGSVVVDVAGKVRRPGIAVLPRGARVIDALNAAGGARKGVDLSTLNLARPLVDGEQLLVGVPNVPGVAAESATEGGAPSGALVNLNTATEAQLEELPGVGPVTAGAIISWREQHQGFGSIEELVEVDGIGEATLAKLAPLVTL